MEKRKSSLECLSYLWKNARRDSHFFQILLNDVRANIHSKGFFRIQVVYINNKGHLSCSDFTFESYVNFISFLDFNLYTFDSEAFRSFDIRVYDSCYDKYFHLLTVYEKSRDVLYRNFESSLF